MKICITSIGPGLDAPVDSRFGRCGGFIFADTEDDGGYEYAENAGAGSEKGAGILAAKTVMEKKPHAVITGNIGPNAASVLANAKIKVYLFEGFSGSAGQALSSFGKNIFKEAKGATVPGHFGQRPEK